MLKKTFGDNLKILRKKRNMTQETAAEACNLSVRYWGQLERGKASASIDTMEKISAGMNVAIGDLFKE